MTVEIIVPALGESITEATVAKWLKAEGDAVEVDEPLVELETDKVSVEINAQTAGVLSEIVAKDGAEVEIGAVLGRISEGDGAAQAKPQAAAEDPPPAGPAAEPAGSPAEAAPAPEPDPPAPVAEAAPRPAEAPPPGDTALALSPAVRKLIDDNRLDPSTIPATGKAGRLTKGDVLAFLESGLESGRESGGAVARPVDGEAPATAPAPPTPAPSAAPPAAGGPRAREERVKMSRLRRRIAERLKEAQNTAAMLTTFNEVDMSAVIAARKDHRDSFEKKHGVRLGFMSFFVKACIVALREIPEVNAEIDGADIVYKNHYDIGVAVGTEQGLVVPVIRDADAMSFAEIEQTIARLGAKAKDGQLTMDDLTGGTFTISNGGVYGSLLSTPILNPPQSGILGMHKIQPRPVVVGDSIEIRPQMYLALSYDHRLVDGRGAVTFLVRVKECIEEPQRILLDI
ncbi:MAG: 2-oxoglutarate dehydrogenase complex dihydrolipoyllysine-residue succinyltransferase [Alphaproteobacteria bacterium]|nr:2-oxoglutarate dehydrogenase complex dihydrolipoyllysine-residue succinyltransferase [Alphaproteobacteria bacterium]